MTTRPTSFVSLSFRQFITFGAAVLACDCTAPAFGQSGAGETITVTTVDDTTDFAAPQQVANLPGPDGRVSFREALIAANNTPGPQTIQFAIPQSEWWLVSGMALLRQENGIFLLTDDGTTVDFSTQTVFTGDTNPNGAEVGIYGLEPNSLGVASIYVNSDNCTIKGLGDVHQRGYAIRIQGNNNRVIACHTDGGLYAAVYITGGFNGTPPTGNVIGGTAPGEGNWLTAGNSGVRIDGPADGNIVIGNFLTGVVAGVEVRSAACCPGNVATNNRIGGATPAERNVISGAGHFGEEGFPTGSQVSLEDAVGTIIEGNYIGTTVDGNAAYPGQRGPGGVSARNSPGTIIRNNLISGIAVTGTNHAAGQRFGTGISLAGNNSNTVIEGNRIGTNAAGTAAVPNVVGVGASFWPGTPSPTNVRIGGTAPGQANFIAFNETIGVMIQAVMMNFRITGNSIHSNGGLGIDLITFGPIATAVGVTPNDPGDGDTGGNNLQNFPIIAAASASPTGTHVTGTLNSTPNSTFTLEFFANAMCDPSGNGEGETFLGSLPVTTDAQGNASFDTLVPGATSAGQAITATATDASGNTSEFSACVAVTGSQAAGDTNGDGQVNVDDLLAVISGWGAARAPPAACLADVNHDGSVGMDDLLMVITHWG